MNSAKKIGIRLAALALAAMALTACHGGGGSPARVIYYPYETVYGSVCATLEPTPGCTFDRATGSRISVTADPHYNDYGNGTNDMWSVQFDYLGTAAVYDEYGHFQYYADVSEFDGYVGGNYIGVGTSGLFWENVLGGTYWLGKNGVIYSANYYESNYGKAINDKTASQATDTNFAAINSEGNKKLIDMAANKLTAEYGFKKEKAVAIASALNSWAISSNERGYTSDTDMDKTFKTVFGVSASDALAAVKDLVNGDKESMRELTNRSANYSGLKPYQAQKFMKAMYKEALAEWGYSENSYEW